MNMRKNPPLNRVRQLGPNMTEVAHGDIVLLYSYETPVAGFAPGIGYFRTDKKWSVTTSKHINKWLGPTVGKVSKLPQATVDHLAMHADPEDVRVAAEGVRGNPPRMYQHPGKFEGELAVVEHLYQQALEYGDDYIGSVQDIGWIATPVHVDAMDLEDLKQRALADGEPLTRGDIAFLRKHPYVILMENDAGFVSAMWYTSKGAFDRKVEELEGEWTDMADGEGF